MTPKEFYKSMPKDVVRQVVQNAKTTMSNFQQIALFNGSVSSKLAQRLAESSGYKMTELEILYPDRYEKNESAA